MAGREATSRARFPPGKLHTIGTAELLVTAALVVTMDRRTFLELTGTTAGGALLAGCVGAAPRAGPRKGSVAGGSESADDLRRAEHGFPPDICEHPIKPEIGIYAITEPAFAEDWTGREIGIEYQYYRQSETLLDDQTVIGLAGDSGARAYPLTVLLYHEVVNDVVDEPVLVSYCPLCQSGMVASRRLRGEDTLFAVSGQLWRPEEIFSRASEQEGRTFGADYANGETPAIRNNGNLVMYDAATHTYWSQLLAHGICGPLAGTDLAILPSTVTTWGEWRRRHPGTSVLLPPPYSETVEPGEILGTETDGPVGPGGPD
jgi:hypothetical protein